MQTATHLTVTAAALVFLLWSLPALAQQCNFRAVLVAALAKNFQEVPVWVGFRGDRSLEIFSEANGESWSLVISHPNGTSCLIVGGDSWLDVKRVPVGTETMNSE